MPRELSSYLKTTPQDQKPIVILLHNTLRAIHSDYEVKKAWGGLAYKREKNYSCMIVSYIDHIKLMIWRGIKLKDPQKILEGKGVNTRHIKYYFEDDIDQDYLKYLVEQQFALYDSGVKWE